MKWKKKGASLVTKKIAVSMEANVKVVVSEFCPTPRKDNYSIDSFSLDFLKSLRRESYYRTELLVTGRCTSIKLTVFNL